MRKILRKIVLYFSNESTVLDDLQEEISRLRKWLKVNANGNRRNISDLHEYMEEILDLIIELKDEKKKVFQGNEGKDQTLPVDGTIPVL